GEEDEPAERADAERRRDGIALALRKERCEAKRGDERVPGTERRRGEERRDGEPGERGHRSARHHEREDRPRQLAELREIGRERDQDPQPGKDEGELRAARHSGSLTRNRRRATFPLPLSLRSRREAAYRRVGRGSGPRDPGEGKGGSPSLRR